MNRRILGEPVVQWDSPTWGSNPVHESTSGSWLEDES